MTPTQTLPKAAVIGAGSSGIAAVKALHAKGFDVTCFEKSDQVGGNWVFGNKNGMSAAYRGLHINTSRDRMEFSDYPMPKSYPDFPHHSHIAEYFNAYVDHFGFRDRIRFETGVEHAERDAETGTWTLTLEDGETERFDALLVANGHHWDRRWPEPAFPGSDTFQGVQMHAHDYVDNEIFKGKDVVIVGMGNSAMDIGVEARPVIDGHDVVFAGGTRVHADYVVYCTGYKISFPFFAADLLAAPDNRIELFRRVFHPDFDNLAFIGLLQPLGAIMPLAEAQGDWVADYLRGAYALPPRAALEADIRADMAAMRRRYVASKRHTIQVDFDSYLHELGRERKRGAERAAAPEQIAA